MKIEVLRRKVDPKKDFNPRVNVVINPDDFPNILEKLNAIIDWPECDFPNDPKTKRTVKKDVTEQIEMIKALAGAQGGQDAQDLIDHFANGTTNIAGIGQVTEENGKYFTEVIEYDQDREFLGPNPELKPGDCFSWQGVHSFGVCEIDGTPTLGLINTGTGPGVARRFVKEHIIPEYNFREKGGKIEFNISEVVFEDPTQGECLIMGAEDTDLSRYIEEPDIFTALKLNYGDWRFLLGSVPYLKDILNNLPRIIHVRCSPLFEEADLWIDKYGNIAFNIGEFYDMMGLNEEELFEYFLPSLKDYFIKNPDIDKNIVLQLPKEEVEEDEVEDIY